MVAAVETMAYAFETTHDIPWHKLGTAVPRGMNTFEEVIVASGLDWRSTLQPMQFVDAWDVTHPVDGAYAVVRDRDQRVLGTVGERYTPLQNVEAFGALDSWLQDGRMLYETAGALHGGKRVFILARIGEDFLVGGKDPITPYALLTNTHDGSAAVTIKLVTTRVVCANTLAVALNEKVGTAVKIRHTASVVQRVAEASHSLDLVSRTQAAMFQKFEQLAQQTASTESLEHVIEMLSPEAAKTATDRVKTSARDERYAVENLYRRSTTIDRGTKWGLFNLATEWLDHTQARSGQNILKSGIMAVERRALYNLEGEASKTRQKVFNYLTVGV